MVSILFAAALLPNLSEAPAMTQTNLPISKDVRMKWWREAKFGMFIHWGLYAVPGGKWKGSEVGGAGEWIMYSGQIPVRDYRPLQPKFNPVKFNADEWVAIAKNAGMKYIVITSKHHDGFCLWDSKLTDWDVANTPFRRDILKELAAACRRGGIKLGFYHSIMDWTHPDYGLRRPWDLRPELPKPDMDRYTAYMKGQLRELLTEYGDVAVVWFDGEWEEPWTHERGKDLYDYVLGLAPRTIVNNRVDKGRAGMAGMTVGDHFRGDFGTPEQEVPARGFPGVDWESCMTMNDTWGFKESDLNWKSDEKLVSTLVDIASKGGNFLLNVGPTAEGLIPGASVERLAAMGDWLKVNGESVYSASASPFGRSPFKWTQKKGALYCHLPAAAPAKPFIAGLKSKVQSIHLLAKPRAIPVAFKQDAQGGIQIEGSLAGAHRLGGVLKIRYQGALVTEEPGLAESPRGEIDLTAAFAEISGSTLRQEDDWLGFWTNAADSPSWTFESKSGGRYRASLDYSVDKGNGGVFEVVLGDQRIRATVASTGGWRMFQTAELGELTLKPGKSKLEIRVVRMDGALMNLRSLRLKRQ